MEMNQNTIIVDEFAEWENVVCLPSKHSTYTIKISNESNYYVPCKIMGDTEAKQGFVRDEDMRVVICMGFVEEGSRCSIVDINVALINYSSVRSITNK